MRLLSIGYPLPHAEVDNHNVLNAPSYFDYDAMFMDPASNTRMAKQLVEGGDAVTAADGRTVVNGTATALSVAGADQFLRRLAETERLLEDGGVVVVVARPNLVQPGIVGFEGCDRYSWLPAPEGISWSSPILRAAEGSQIRILDDHHPVEALIRRHRRSMGYRAVFDARHAAFQNSGQTWAEAKTGLAIGADFDVLGGKVVFMPAIVNETGLDRAVVAESIVTAVRGLLGVRSATNPPFWTARFPLPGLVELDSKAHLEKQSMKTAIERFEEAESAARELGMYRDLLWADGPNFQLAVQKSLTLIGFEVISVSGQPLVIKEGEDEAFIEVESSRQQVEEWPYVRLQRRLEENLLKSKVPSKGIVIVNSERLKDPKDRSDRVNDKLRIACKNYRYSLTTAETLFELVGEAIEGCDEEVLDGFRRRIMRGVGLLSREELKGDEADGDSAGSLF